MIFNIKINEGVFENFSEASLFRSIEMGCAEFKFLATNSKKQTFPFGKGASCEVLIDKNKLLTGFINTVGGNYDAVTHNVFLIGRDKTQDLIDSSINGILDLKGKNNLIDVIKRILRMNNITGIDVKSEFAIAPFGANEKVTSEPNENAFSFIEKLCRRRQVLFTTNEDGDIVLTRAGSNRYSTILQSSVTSKENNLLSASFQDSDQERYNTYLVFTQGNLLSGTNDDTVEIKKGSPAIDKNIRASRILRINTELSNEIQTLGERAIWESNIRRVRAFQYNCRIRGYYLDRANTILVKPNNIITVNDEMLGIKKDLLIKSCRYVKSIRNGSYTDLQLVNQDSYTLQASQNEVEAKFDKNNIFTGLSS